MGGSPDELELRGPGGVLLVRRADSIAVDFAMLIAGETSGRPLAEVLAQFGRSRSAYYEKLQRFREQGLSGLLRQVPGPRGPSRRSLEAISFIVTQRLNNPGRSAEAIAGALAARGIELSVRSVERTLSEFGLTRSAASSGAGPGRE